MKEWLATPALIPTPSRTKELIMYLDNLARENDHGAASFLPAASEGCCTVEQQHGQRPRVIEFCAECATPPQEELVATHYWVLGGSD
jgi:hypothetical protein